MKCTNCGAAIDKGNRFCTVCGTPIATGGSGKKKNKNRREKRPHEKSGIGSVLIPLAIFFLLIIGIAVFFMYRAGVLNYRKKYKTTHKEYTAEDVRLMDNGQPYVSSQLYLTAAEGAKYKDVEALVKKAGGEVVGYLEATGSYQIEFPGDLDADALEALSASLAESELIEDSILNKLYSVSFDSISYEGDEWVNTENAPDEQDQTQGSELSYYPNGNNWWLEAVGMKTVWDADLLAYHYTSVGVMDTTFDSSHEDLSFRSCFYTDDDVVEQYYQSRVNDAVNAGSPAEGYISQTAKLSHGTNVAGIIGARAGNGGTAGISQHSILYGYSLYNNSDLSPLFPDHGVDYNQALANSLEEYTSVCELEYALSLFANEGVKVVNISMGCDELIVSTWYDTEIKGLTSSSAIDETNQLSRHLERFLGRLFAIDKNHEFLIVKAAGNERAYRYSEDGSGSDPDTDHPFSLYKDSGEGRNYSGISSQYDIFSNISDPTVRDHILIVGALDMTYTYTTMPLDDDTVWSAGRYYSETSFSDLDPDIYAPGGVLTVRASEDLPFGSDSSTSYKYELLSTFPEGYGAMQGTSQATPIVSGIASLVLSYSPDISISDLRRCLLNTQTQYVQTYPGMVNAVYALRAAAELPGAPKALKDAVLDCGWFTGYTHYKDENGRDAILTEGTIKLYDEDWNEVYTTDIVKDGTFSIYTKAGHYYLYALWENEDENGRDLAYITEIDIFDENEYYQPLKLKNRAVAEYEFAVHRTVKDGSWNETCEIEATADYYVGPAAFGWTVGVDSELSVQGYDEEHRDMSGVTAQGTAHYNAFGFEVGLDTDYVYDTSTYTYTLLGQSFTFEYPGDPGILDFTEITEELLEYADTDDHLIEFSLADSSTLDVSELQIFKELSNLSVDGTASARVTITLKDDFSLDTVTYDLYGGIDYEGVGAEAEFTLLYTFE